MGEITVRGYAKKEIDCDLVKYELKFQSEGTSVPESLKKVNGELEKFLSVAEENGIETDNFKVESNTTREIYNKRNTYIAERIISAVFPMDSAFLNSIINLISSNNINVMTSEQYLISGKEEIHRELLKLAIDDSRKKAEMIASCAGTKITGIKSLLSNPEEYPFYKENILRDRNIAVASADFLSDNLSSPTKEESETVEIVWNIE